MKDKDYDSMRRNHIEGFGGEEDKNKKLNTLGSLLGKRIVNRQDMSKKTTAGQTEKEKPKTAIWWMIMIFCIVYGIEIVYNALLEGGPIN